MLPHTSINLSTVLSEQPTYGPEPKSDDVETGERAEEKSSDTSSDGSYNHEKAASEEHFVMS